VPTAGNENYSYLAGCLSRIVSKCPTSRLAEIIRLQSMGYTTRHNTISTYRCNVLIYNGILPLPVSHWSATVFCGISWNFVTRWSVTVSNNQR